MWTAACRFLQSQPSLHYPFMTSIQARIGGGHQSRLMRANGKARLSEFFLGLPDTCFTKMKNRGGQNRRGMAVADPCDEIIQSAHAAGRDDGHRYSIGNRARERDVVARARAVAVHRREQDFAGAIFDEALGVCDGVEAGGVAAAMRE